MVIKVSGTIEGICWEDAAEIFRTAPLSVRDPTELERAFDNSEVKCVVWDGQKLIGMGRAITDGVYQAAIYDVVVLPAYQGQGVGTKIMEWILKELAVPNIILYATPGKQPFYRNLGFREMKTAMGVFKSHIGDPESGFVK